MLLINKLSLIIFSFNVYFKMAASIGNHLESIKSKYLLKVRIRFPCSLKILLQNIILYLLCSFPFKCKCQPLSLKRVLTKTKFTNKQPEYFNVKKYNEPGHVRSL